MQDLFIFFQLYRGKKWILNTFKQYSSSLKYATMPCFYKCCTSLYTNKKEARSFSEWKLNGFWWSLVIQNCFGLRLLKGSKIGVRVGDNLWFQELHKRRLLGVHFPGRHERNTFYTREVSNVISQYWLYQYSVWWTIGFIVATFRALGFANKTINDSESEASQESPPLHE